MINDVVFYNHWHNGDIFIPKNYMVNLITQLMSRGNFKYYIHHPNSKKLLADIVDLQYLPMDSNVPDATHRVLKKDNKVYINTWVGAYFGFFKENQLHSNINIINTIWNSIYYTFQTLTDIDLHVNKLIPKDGIPTTNWEMFSIEHAKQFVREKTNIVLFCNGPSRSMQNSVSNINSMEKLIQILAEEHPNNTFVCTHKFHLEKNYNNIYFTDDIFASVTDGDINEIAYISTFCDVIVGKNSGPYIYCHTRDNINRNCTFISVSDRQSDSYLYDFYDMEARHIYFIGKKETRLHLIINQLLESPIQFPKVSAVDDIKLTQLFPILDLKNY
jgi:hypothetical protein